MSEELSTEAIAVEVTAILTEGGALEANVSYNGAWLVSASFPCRGYADDVEGGMSGAVGPKAYAGDTRRTNGDPRALAASFVADARAHAAKMEAFFAPVLAPEPEQVETPQDESDGETGEAAEGSEAGYPLGHASEDAVSGDAGQTGDVGAGRELEVGRTGLGDEVSNGDDMLSGEGWDVDGAGDIRDADFTIEDLGSEDDLLADEAQDTLAIEGADLETEAAPDGPIAYGASTIDGLVREKLGRVSQIARELKAVQQEGWTVEEYAYLQNLMVRMDRGEAPDDQASRERFLAIAVKSQAMSRIDAVRDRKEGELEDIGQRRDFDAAVYYEPGEGWP